MARNMGVRLELIGGIVLLGALPVLAQEMEPRAYSPSPVGTNLLAVALGDSRGGILFDPSIPITDVSATVHQLSADRRFKLGF